MKKLFVSLIALILLAFGTAPLMAKAKNVKVRGGKSTVIGYHVLLEGRSCRGMDPGKASVRKGPSNGKVRFTKGIWTPTKGRCKGYRIPYIDFIYTGNGKPDYVEISVSGAMYVGDHGHRAWYYKYNINK